MELTYHYPPDLFDLMIDCIPRLNRSKRGLLDFFRGAGVDRNLILKLEQQLRQNASQINKFDMTRFVLKSLNEREDNDALRQRREILKRVTEFDSFDQCWPADLWKAKAFVAEIREVINKKDTFTRISLEREKERQLRIAENNAKLEAIRLHREKIDNIRKALGILFSMIDPQKRGKALEPILNSLFEVSGILIRESFTLAGDNGEGIVEQIDGTIELDGHVYIVEMKWLKDSMGKGDMSEQLVRLFTRSEARGIVISASGFSRPALAVAKEALSHKVIVLIELSEIVRALESYSDLSDLFRKKIQSAVVEKNPFLRT